MEREIKFRAWDKKYKDMASFEKMMANRVFAIADGLDPKQFIVIPSHENVVLMQYTGLKDKNGVEIYEFDIVKCFDHPTGVDSATGKVFFAQGAFRVQNTICPLADFGTAWTEVIGNIYENKELLEYGN